MDGTTSNSSSSAGETCLGSAIIEVVSVSSAPPTESFKHGQEVLVAYTLEDAAAYTERLLADLREDGGVPSCLGFDIEIRPRCGLNGDFYGSGSGSYFHGVPRNRTGLLQLASTRTVLLTHLSSLGGDLPSNLRGLLADPTILKVGCGTIEDAACLMEDYSAEVLGVADLGRMGALLGRRRPGLRGLSEDFGRPLPKPRHITMSNWDQNPLSEAQVQYAAADACCSLWLAQCLWLHHCSSGAAAAGSAIALTLADGATAAPGELSASAAVAAESNASAAEENEAAASVEGSGAAASHEGVCDGEPISTGPKPSFCSWLLATHDAAVRPPSDGRKKKHRGGRRHQRGQGCSSDRLLWPSSQEDEYAVRGWEGGAVAAGPAGFTPVGWGEPDPDVARWAQEAEAEPFAAAMRRLREGADAAFALLQERLQAQYADALHEMEASLRAEHAAARQRLEREGEREGGDGERNECSTRSEGDC